MQGWAKTRTAVQAKVSLDIAKKSWNWIPNIIPILWCLGVFGNWYPQSWWLVKTSFPYYLIAILGNQSPVSGTPTRQLRQKIRWPVAKQMTLGARNFWNGCGIKHKQTTDFHVSLIETTISNENPWPWNQNPIWTGKIQNLTSCPNQFAKNILPSVMQRRHEMLRISTIMSPISSCHHLGHGTGLERVNLWMKHSGHKTQFFPDKSQWTGNDQKVDVFQKHVWFHTF